MKEPVIYDGVIYEFAAAKTSIPDQPLVPDHNLKRAIRTWHAESQFVNDLVNELRTLVERSLP
jgi:hypothetical protein